MKTLPSTTTFSWLIFVACSTLTWLIYFFMTSFGRYYEVLPILGALTLGIGVWVLQENGWTHRAMSIVALGLLLGQWWFLEFGIASVLWTVHDFAP